MEFWQILQLLRLICHYCDLPTYVVIISTCRTIRYTFPTILTPVSPQEIMALPTSRNFFLANMIARTVNGVCEAIDLLVEFLQQPDDLDMLPDYLHNPYLKAAILYRSDQLIPRDNAWLGKISHYFGHNYLRKLRNVTFSWAYENNCIWREHLPYYRIDCSEIFVSYLLTHRVSLNNWEIFLILRRNPQILSSLQFVMTGQMQRIREEFTVQEFPIIHLQECRNEREVLNFARALKYVDNPLQHLQKLSSNWKLAVIRVLLGNFLLESEEMIDHVLQTLDGHIIHPIFAIRRPNKNEMLIIKHLKEKHSITIIFPS